jgi:prepilin-type N-terminal cleavage/methylation domain-containing protein
MSGVTRARGFTLIELMVVIAIIGLLSSIILASLSNSKDLATNSRVSQDIHQFQNALELYYTKYGGYPQPGTGTNAWTCLGKYSGYCWDQSTPTYADDSTLDAALSPFIPGPPTGQTITGGGYTFIGYIYKATGCNSGTPVTCTNYVIYWVMSHANQVCAGQNGRHNDVENFKAGTLTECQLFVPS